MTPIKEQAVELIGRLTEEDTVFIVRIMENLNDKERSSVKESAVDSFFALADSLHLNSNGKKWARDELYDRQVLS